MAKQEVVTLGTWFTEGGFGIRFAEAHWTLSNQQGPIIQISVS